MRAAALAAAAAALLAAAARAQDARFPPVQLWACGGASSANQTWTLNATGQPAGTTRVSNPRGLFWDLDGPRNATGTLVHLVFRLSSLSQDWRWDAARGRWASAFAPGMCAVPRGAFAGAPLALAPCGSSRLEEFAYDAAAGTFSLAAAPSLCIDSGTAASTCASAPTSAFPFCDAALGARARAADLAGRLTVDEAASLVSNENFGVPRFGIARVGYGEALHGYLRGCVATPVPGSTGCPTSFPHLHLLGGSFNRTLWRAVGAAIADEARAYFNLVNRTSHLVSWAPDINVRRLPRRAARRSARAAHDPPPTRTALPRPALGPRAGGRVRGPPPPVRVYFPVRAWIAGGRGPAPHKARLDGKALERLRHRKCDGRDWCGLHAHELHGRHLAPRRRAVLLAAVSLGRAARESRVNHVLIQLGLPRLRPDEAQRHGHPLVRR